MPTRDKYAHLTHFLVHCGQDEIEMSFEHVSNLVGGIPPSKITLYPWGNDWNNRFCLGWLNAGYRAKANQRTQTVLFYRDSTIGQRKTHLSNTYSASSTNSTLYINKAISNIRKFHETTSEGIHTRYRSWEHCYKAFRENWGKQGKVDHLSLHLACYLASWGMLRNSFLLNRDYKVHIPLVEFIQNGEYDDLLSENHTVNTIPLVMSLSLKIKKAYGNVSVSDTLVTKILLGIFGCAPAYDRYYIYAARKYKVCSGSWNEKSLRDVWRYYDEHKDTFEKIRFELRPDGFIYPPMKIMDMCLWQIGFDEDPKKENMIDDD